MNRAQESFDSEQQAELLAQAHAIVIDKAAWASVDKLSAVPVHPARILRTAVNQSETTG